MVQAYCAGFTCVAVANSDAGGADIDTAGGQLQRAGLELFFAKYRRYTDLADGLLAVTRTAATLG